jgi:hypothetical protein
LCDIRQRSRLNLVVALYWYRILPTVNEISYYKIYRTDVYIWKTELTFTSLGTLGRVCETMWSLVCEIYQGLWSLTGRWGLWENEEWQGITSNVTTGHRHGTTLRIRTDHWRETAAHVWAATSEERCIVPWNEKGKEISVNLKILYTRLNGCLYQRYFVQKKYNEKCSYDCFK